MRIGVIFLSPLVWFRADRKALASEGGHGKDFFWHSHHDEKLQLLLKKSKSTTTTNAGHSFTVEQTFVSGWCQDSCGNIIGYEAAVFHLQTTVRGLCRVLERSCECRYGATHPCEALGYERFDCERKERASLAAFSKAFRMACAGDGLGSVGLQDNFKIPCEFCHHCGDCFQ